MHSKRVFEPLSNILIMSYLQGPDLTGTPFGSPGPLDHSKNIQLQRYEKSSGIN